MKKNIVLVGFMGCGKSTIGKVLSYKLNAQFLDTDTQIQKDMKMAITDIFANYGEEYFRMLERNLCKLIAVNEPLIVATGGGIIKNKANLDALKVNGSIFYIKSSPEKIYSNIKNDTSRPLLNGTSDKLKRIKELLEERAPLYESCADFVVDTTNSQIDGTVSMIIKIMKENNYDWGTA